VNIRYHKPARKSSPFSHISEKNFCTVLTVQLRPRALSRFSVLKRAWPGCMYQTIQLKDRQVRRGSDGISLIYLYYTHLLRFVNTFFLYTILSCFNALKSIYTLKVRKGQTKFAILRASVPSWSYGQTMLSGSAP
jgi:hypothetical protein